MPRLTGFELFCSRHEPMGGRALVVGSKVYDDKFDRRTLYADAFGVDLFEGKGVDLVHDLERPLPDSVGQFTHVDCCSVLEHVQRPWRMAENIEAALVEGGTLLISVPFVWRVHGYPDDYWRMSPSALGILFPNIQWKDRRYVVGEKLMKRVPGQFDGETRWMARAETVAFGVKCAAKS
jgi:SAM-dependent methyltransferase